MNLRPSSPRRRASALVASCALLISPSVTNANMLVAAAVEEGRLDNATGLLYELYEVLQPPSLPEQFRQPATSPATCGTPLMTRARAALDEYGDEYRREAAKLLQQRPELETSLLTPSGHFRVHYSIEGFEAVDPTDNDNNQIPDYIDIVSAALDSAWKLQIDLLGYRQPLSDEGAGGGDEYDVYVLELGTTGKYGFVRAENSSPRPFSFMQIDNDYTDDAYGRRSSCFGTRGTRELDALHVTTAHEFFHAVQFAYYHGNDSVWWEEASSTWMEEVAYPEADDYLQYVCDFLLAPDRSLDSGSAFSQGTRIYGASIFAHFLDQRYDTDLIRQIWEQHSRRTNASTDNFDRVLRSVTPGGLADVVSEFAVWNYFTGVRHREEFYEDGAAWPAINVQSTSLNTTGGLIQGRVDHLASAYLRFAFPPEFGPGGLIIDTHLERGGWRRQLALVSGDSLEVLSRVDNVTPLTIADWDTYDEVVLILTNTERVGIGFQYTVKAEFDVDLTERAIPAVFAVKRAYPNPFVAGEDQQVFIDYDVNDFAFLTFSVFTSNGQLVHRLELPSREPNTHLQEEIWNGRNEAGKLVESGLYYYVLEGEGMRADGTLAVVRE